MSNTNGEGRRRSRRSKGDNREASVERQKRKADKREKSRRERSIDRRSRAEAGQSGLDGGDSFVSLGGGENKRDTIDIKDMNGDMIIDGFGGDYSIVVEW